MNIEVIPPQFDPDRWNHELQQIYYSSKGDTDILKRRTRLLVQRIYETGVQDGKNDTDWYEKELEEKLRVKDD